jgi:hypothetical protein
MIENWSLFYLDKRNGVIEYSHQLVNCSRTRWFHKMHGADSRVQSYEHCVRIRDVLMRVRIRGPVPLDYESGSSSFLLWLSRHKEKISYFLTAGIFTFFFKDN